MSHYQIEGTVGVKLTPEQVAAIVGIAGGTFEPGREINVPGVLIIEAASATDAANAAHKAGMRFDGVSPVVWKAYDPPEVDPNTGEPVAGGWYDNHAEQVLEIVSWCEACNGPVADGTKYGSDQEGCYVCEDCMGAASQGGEE